MTRTYLFLAAVITLISLPSRADILSVHCPLGCPSNPKSNHLIFGHLYALSNNPNTKFADWVAYEVDVLNFGPSPGRTWATDPLLEEHETLEENDYKDASKALNTDRGHQAPLASFAGSQYWDETNYLSNITPQKRSLNQGPWKKLESAIRSAVGFRDSLFVITGVVYENPTEQLPKADEKHQIPTAYYKIIYDLKGNAASFLMEQQLARDVNFCDSSKRIIEIMKKLDYSLPQLTNNTDILQRLGC